jgi:hypothetical protein
MNAVISGVKGNVSLQRRCVLDSIIIYRVRG